MVQDKQARPRKPMSYENVIYLFLSLYRFFSYVLAVVLTQAIPLDPLKEPDVQTYLIVGLVGFYTLLKVFSPLLWQQRYPWTYVVLGFDLVACILPLMFTGGLDSGFLLYALTPVMSAALMFRESVAFITSGLLSLSLLLAHMVGSQWSDEFAWIMNGNYLPLLMIYIIFLFLIAILTYRTNLNIRRHIEADAVLGERRRIRRELHDGVAQSLSYLNMKTKSLRDAVSSQSTDQALAGLEDIRKVVKDTYEDIRIAIDSLSETRIFPLVRTLAEYVQEFGEANSIDAKFEPPEGDMKLSHMAELQLLQVAHESLTNVRKHAQASSVWIKMDNSPQGVEMIIKDNGRGFSLAGYREDSAGHHGLIIMAERVESLGGTCDIVSNPGEGTEVTIRIPAEKVRL